MAYCTLVSPAELSFHLNDPLWIVVDCRFVLADDQQGRANYEALHIPGAVYAHLNDDLSGPIHVGVTGRHPLPTPEATAATFGRLGITAGMQVVAYDDLGGAIAAARLWWMLRWLGHDAVAVLDGGWQRWLKENFPLKAGWETRPAQTFIPYPRPEKVVNADQVEAIRQDTAHKLFDARSADRYRGENETVHPVAGHIPGAISAPYADNLTPEGLFRSPEELRARYTALLGSTRIENVVMSCGSGVTANHNILALEIAGLGEAKLYPGSWSEWITDPKRPVEKG